MGNGELGMGNATAAAVPMIILFSTKDSSTPASPPLRMTAFRHIVVILSEAKNLSLLD